jgi:hypothetical protein
MFSKLAADIRAYAELTKTAGWERQWALLRQRVGLPISGEEYRQVAAKLNSPGHGAVRKLLMYETPEGTLPAALYELATKKFKQLRPEATKELMERAERIRQAYNDSLYRRADKAIATLAQTPGVTPLRDVLRKTDLKNSYFRSIRAEAQAGIPGNAPIFTTGIPEAAGGYMPFRPLLYGDYSPNGQLFHIGNRSSLLRGYPQLKFTPHNSRGKLEEVLGFHLRQMRSKATPGYSLNTARTTLPAAGKDAVMDMDNSAIYEGMVPSGVFMRDPSRQTYNIVQNKANYDSRRKSPLEVIRRALAVPQDTAGSAALATYTDTINRLRNVEVANRVRRAADGVMGHNFNPFGNVGLRRSDFVSAVK